MHFSYTADLTGAYMAPTSTLLSQSEVLEGKSLLQDLWNHLLRHYPGAYATGPATATIGLSSDFFPDIPPPELRNWGAEEEVEYGGGNLDHFNFNLGYQKKLVGQMTNPSSIVLTNLGSDSSIPSEIRGYNYSPSHTYDCITIPLGEQALVPRNLTPS